jgi:sterol desaturase/sphingolipid hydroxylase (fatty acid hydroxylase superfamily)
MDVYRHLVSFTSDLLRLSLWLVLFLAVFVPLERIFGKRSQPVFRKFFATDVFYYFLNGIVPKLLLTLSLIVLVAGLHRLVPLAFYSSVAAMPIWIRLAGALVVNEIGGYWGHRWSHEIPFLWRFHAIHHSAEEIDWLVTAKSHPADMFFTHLCASVPVYVLGLAQPLGNSADGVPMAVTVLTMYWAYFIHANVSWRFGWLEWLISTPHFHHWHHANDGPEVVNKNYAATFPWADKCFGTLYLPKVWPQRYGSDTPVAAGLVGQLLDPLTQYEPASGAGLRPAIFETDRLPPQAAESAESPSTSIETA